jgi:hypothetical protein
MPAQVIAGKARGPGRLASPVQVAGRWRACHGHHPVGEQRHELLAVADVTVERCWLASQGLGHVAHRQRGRPAGVEQGHGRVEDGLERQQPVPLRPLSLKFLRPATVATGPVTAEGTVVHLGQRTALAEGRITDAEGKIYATATSSCILLRPEQP